MKDIRVSVVLARLISQHSMRFGSSIPYDAQGRLIVTE